MPRMDGIDFLGRLMRLRPTPVVMISTLTERGAEVTLKALELGAVDFVAKPRVGLSGGLNELAGSIVTRFAWRRLPRCAVSTGIRSVLALQCRRQPLRQDCWGACRPKS